jgi:cyclase
MLNPRIIPCLLVQNKGLVKTNKFSDSKYVGDPINAVKIFNEKEVDELIVLDIDATRLGKEPDFKLIEKLAYECQMPLCYGGGIKNVNHAQRIFALGVEKIAISSIAIEEPYIIKEISDRVGSQSVVVVIDVKRKLFGGYDIYTHNGKRKSNMEFMKLLDVAQEFGAGEVVINSIDNDGMMKGYDHNLIDVVRNRINIPLTVLGGAASMEDFGMVIEKHGILGLAAGSLFVFNGKYKAVLINYPSPKQKNELIKTKFIPNWSK